MADFAQRVLAHAHQRRGLPSRVLPATRDASSVNTSCTSLKQRFSLGHGLAFHSLGHKRSRGGGDGAAAALEAPIYDHAVLDTGVHAELVAAQRVEAVRAVVELQAGRSG